MIKDSSKEIFIPNGHKLIDQNDIFRYLQNIEQEINEGLFTQNELLLLQKALYGKYLDTKKKDFFLYHFVPIWEYSVKQIINNYKCQNILDLGCGTGTSSFLFSFLGSKVIGIDYEKELINICKKRKLFYDEMGVELKTTFYHSDAFSFPYNHYGPFDAVFSLFAFNLMKPPKTLLENIIPNIKKGGIILIIDGNQSSIYPKLFHSYVRSGVLKPMEMKVLLQKFDVEVLDVQYHCALPSFVFQKNALANIGLLLEKILIYLNMNKYFDISYSIIGIKR